MEKVIIYRNEAEINRLTELCNTAKAQFQSLYNGFKEMGATPTVQKMVEVITANKQGKGIESKIKEVIFDCSPEKSFAGMTYNREKFMDMLDVPAKLVEIVKACEFAIMETANFITISTDTVNTVKDFETFITERLTVYAQNQKQIDMFNFLTGMLAGLNQYINTVEREAPLLKGFKIESLNEGYKVDYRYILQIL